MQYRRCFCFSEQIQHLSRPELSREEEERLGQEERSQRCLSGTEYFPFALEGRSSKRQRYNNLPRRRSAIGGLSLLFFYQQGRTCRSPSSHSKPRSNLTGMAWMERQSIERIASDFRSPRNRLGYD